MLESVIFGRLSRTEEGTILNNLGCIRGINPLDSLYVKGNPIATGIKYHSKNKPPKNGLCDDFIFYQELPFEIEGMQFKFIEVYPGKNKQDSEGKAIIPLKQLLYILKDGRRMQTFEFHRGVFYLLKKQNI
jgi:hypothetical protein